MASSANDSRRIPAKLYVLNALIYFISIPVTAVFAITTRIFGGLSSSLSEALSVLWAILFSPQVLIFIAVLVAWLIFSSKFVYGKLKAFDNSESSMDSSNKIQSILVTGNIVIALAGCYIFPALANQAAKARSIESFQFIPVLLLYFGITILVAILVYIFWIESF